MALCDPAHEVDARDDALHAPGVRDQHPVDMMVDHRLRELLERRVARRGHDIGNHDVGDGELGEAARGARRDQLALLCCAGASLRAVLISDGLWP